MKAEIREMDMDDDEEEEDSELEEAAVAGVVGDVSTSGDSESDSDEYNSDEDGEERNDDEQKPVSKWRKSLEMIGGLFRSMSPEKTENDDDNDEVRV